MQKRADNPIAPKGNVHIFIENRYKCKNGTYKWIEWKVLSIAQKNKFIAVGRDITGRKQAEEALKKSEERFRLAAKSTSDLIYEWDVDSDQLDWFGDIDGVLGFDSGEIERTIEAWVKRIHPDDQELLKDAIELHRISTKPLFYEYRIMARDGSWRHWIDRGMPILDENGSPAKWVGTCLDITERRRIEEDKRKALKFAAEQSKHALIGQVTSKMAHDFNNILMGIMGNAQLAFLDCNDESIKNMLDHIIEFSERGRDIASSLLSYSKDHEPKQTNFRIEDKIELVLKLLEKELAGIKVSRIYNSDIPELLADPGMIQDVITNLIQNSIHALSKTENPALILKAYSLKDKVYFEIEDNGCGIPIEHQHSIYTPAFTLKGSHDQTGSYQLGIEGSGYGMSNIKKYIVEKHKGEIFLESEVGKGTKITISLRLIKNYLSSKEIKEVRKSHIYDRRTILLVEDETAIADVQYQILTREPFYHTVSKVVNGQMAIDVFDRNIFDAVSLDYMLPGDVSGLDVYHHIRNNNKDIPIMLISGNIEFMESMKTLKAKDPNLEYLSKPVDNLSYMKKINKLIEKKETSQT